MRIPKTLKVGGIDYKVIKRKILVGEARKFFAVAKHRQATIEIASTYNEEAYSTQKIEECFIHELVHCVDEIYNNQKLDEPTVERLSQGIYQTLKDNGMLK